MAEGLKWCPEVWSSEITGGIVESRYAFPVYVSQKISGGDNAAFLGTALLLDDISSTNMTPHQKRGV